MRTGEVFALTWDDIDLENRIIKIMNTYPDNYNLFDKLLNDCGYYATL